MIESRANSQSDSSVKTLKKGKFALVGLLAAGPIPKVRGNDAEYPYITLNKNFENIKFFSARELTSPEELPQDDFFEARSQVLRRIKVTFVLKILKFRPNEQEMPVGLLSFP